MNVETDPIIELGTPEFLFAVPYLAWDIHPNDKRFLMLKSADTADGESPAEAPRKIIVVTNWFEELKERVPVD